MNTPTARAIVNEMRDTFGQRLMIHDGDEDEALDCLVRELEESGLTRDDVIFLLAFATRRLWHKVALTTRTHQHN